MNQAATRPAKHGAAPAAADGLRSYLLQPTAVGLLVASIVAAALGGWLIGQKRSALLSEGQQRAVITEAVALAQLVGAADEDRVPALLDEWARGVPEPASARVVKIGGSRLIASNFAGDLAAGAAPRRLQREEKVLFDLAQALRSNVESNLDEEVSRKLQLVISAPAPGRLSVAAPYRGDGNAIGMVQVERDVSSVSVSTFSGFGLVLAFAPVVVFLAGARLIAGPASALERPWARYAFAAVLLSLSVYSFGRAQLASTAALQQQVVQSVAAQQTPQRALFASMTGRYELALVAPDSNASSPWDVDPYERPRGQVTSGGEVIEGDESAGLGAALATTRSDINRIVRGNWVLGLIVLSFFALGFARRVRETLREHRYAYGYVSPAMIGMLILVFFPFFYGVLLSFTDQTQFNENEPILEHLVGIDNFVTILGDIEVAKSTDGVLAVNYKNFYWTLFITVCWTVFNVVIGVTVGMILALALNTEGLRFRTVYRVLLVLPWAIPNYITALTWKGMFHPQLGQVNQAIQMFGGQPIAWFDGVFSSFITGLATNGWLSFPFMMVVVLGALQSIPGDMYEAAELDGASRWQRFRHITLPLLKPALIPAIIVSVVWTFNMFNVIYLVSEGQPAGANEILITEAYKIAFEQYQYGYAAAYSVVIFGILLLYGVFQVKMSKATEGV